MLCRPLAGKRGSPQAIREMREWFQKLKVAHKLMLISIFFVLPDSVMLYLFITAINDNIQFARMEQKGNEYQRPLEELLELLPQHRQLAQRAMVGEPAARSQIARKAAQIDTSFRKLDEVDARIGAELQFTDEGLAKRHREHFRARTVHAEWQQLKDQLPKLSAEACGERHQHLVADIRAMITHSGDTSNLILDPDLDSYYMMDATLLTLPQAQDRLATVMATGEAVLRQAHVTHQDRQQFAVFVTMLQQQDLDRITSSMETSLREDPNFYGTSPSLQERIPTALRSYVGAMQAFIRLTKRFVYLEGVDVTVDEYLSAGKKARDASFKLWRIADEEVDVLLQKRIEAYQSRRAKSLLVAAGALLAAIGFVTFITRSISRPLRQQALDLTNANAALEAEIAERKRAEEELRHSETQLAAAQIIARIGSWGWDIAANRIDWSEENFRIHGLEPGAIEISYDAMLEFVHPDDRDLSEKTFLRAVKDGMPFSFEQRILLRDGSERVLHQRGEPVLGGDGKVAEVFGTAQDITERKRAEAALEKAHRELLGVSRRAGMAEVATGVLHNVGNVLNSVNVSALLISDRIRKSRVAHLTQVAAALQENAADLGTFITSDPKGSKLPGFIASLAERLRHEQEELIHEADDLSKNVAHIKEIVAVQQSYAKVSGVVEALPAVALVEDALAMNGAAFARHHVEVVREFEDVPPVRVDKHKVLQILINVIRNAKYAVSESQRSDKRMIVKISRNGDERVKIAVSDNGVGIAQENLARIFAHGFTTKHDGHGFGLHSSALAAKELGGSLIAHSDGLGLGATFTLELPMEPAPTT